MAGGAGRERDELSGERSEHFTAFGRAFQKGCMRLWDDPTRTCRNHKKCRRS